MIILVHSWKRNEENKNYVAVSEISRSLFPRVECEMEQKWRRTDTDLEPIHTDNDRFWLLLGYATVVEGFGDQATENNSRDRGWNLVFRADNNDSGS